MTKYIVTIGIVCEQNFAFMKRSTSLMLGIHFSSEKVETILTITP